MSTTTIDPHARDAKGVFDVTPPAVETAIQALLDANARCFAAPVCPWQEAERLRDLAWEAKRECERVILEHQGRGFLSGYYRVGGWLVGMRKVGKGPMDLVMKRDESTMKGESK